ncbi:MAG TPA: hypothetical protein VF743_05055, partial [Acidimicrobiales bacterium]
MPDTTAPTAPTAPAAPAAPAPGGPGTPATRPDEVLDSTRLVLEDVRQRADALNAAADRAESVRYAERGAALDEARRAYEGARHEADQARQQAQRERLHARELERDADDLIATGRRPGADSRFAQQMADRNRALARAADERARRHEETADEAGARATDLDHRVVELQAATDDGSVAVAIRKQAIELDGVGDQLERKVD